MNLTNIDRKRIDQIYNALTRANIQIKRDACEQILLYHNYLRENNEDLNMTRIHNFDAMIRKHYIDSLIILNILNESGISLPSTIMDLGTGPGLPGIPLAIANTNIEFILTEGRKNRCDFLRECIKISGIKNAIVVDKKVNYDFDYPVPGIITRAFSNIAETIRRTDNVLEENGLLILMKGPNCDPEIQETEELYGENYSLILNRSYTLPDSNDRRRLVVYRRKSPRGSLHEKDHRISEYPFQFIESSSNPRFKIWKTLNSSRGIKKNNLAIASGIRMIYDILDTKITLCDSLIFDSENSALRFIEECPVEIDFYNRKILNLSVLDKKLFSELDFNNTGSPLLILNVPEFTEWESNSDTDGFTLFLPLSDPENLGAALRTVKSFPPDRVVLLKESCHPYLPKALRSAAGITPGIEILSGPSLDELKTSKQLYYLDMDGEDIDSVKFPDNFSLIVGMESGNIGKISGKSVGIPMAAGIDSLNASVATGIALYEISKSRKLK